MITPLAWFGLPENADENALKRAYAKRLRDTRPDIDPEGFQHLRERYEEALAFCRRDVPRDVTPTTGVQTPPAATAEKDISPPPIPLTDPAWHVVHFDEAHAAAVQAPTPFDAENFASACRDLAMTTDAATLSLWLREQPELWSLSVQQEAGQQVVRMLFRDQPPVSADGFDAMLQFFGLDHALTGLDPFQLQQLRKSLDERHALIARFEPAVAAWNTESADVNAETVFRWFCAFARDHAPEPVVAALHAQPSLRTWKVREQLAQELLELVVRERPPIPAGSALTLFHYFRLPELAASRGVSLQDLPNQLEIRWLMLAENTPKLAMRVRDAKKPFGEVKKAERYLRWVQRPFHGWWIVLASLMPGLPTALGLFLWRLSDASPARLPLTIDPKLVRFCIAAASRHLVSGPRVLIGAIRCAILLVLGALLDALWFVVLQEPYGEPGSASLLIAALVITATWAAYLLFVALLLWQRQPEEPMQPRPWLRLLFVPGFCGFGLLVWWAGGSSVVTVCLLLPAASLAYGRFRGRNPLPSKQERSRWSSVPDTMFFIALWISLHWAPLMALPALAAWVADLWCQRERLRLRPAPRPTLASSQNS
ncbi:hypothetical protein [Dyella japonica]|uniref:J domain-containing protein n=1 Tax=Dyella japonica TaxID=231455 RepID=A0ABV2K391_9GAMM